MLRLHYAPDNAAPIIRIALEELELPFETRLVDRRVSARRSAECRKLNPRSPVPVLETPDGPIFETAAILLWLADPAGALAPAPGSPRRGPFPAWIFAFSDGVQTDLRQMLHTDRFAGPDPDAIARHRALTVARLRAGLDRLEIPSGQGHPWFCGAQTSMLDFYLAAMLRWLALCPPGHTGWFHLADRPALHALAARIETRPAVWRAAAAGSTARSKAPSGP